MKAQRQTRPSEVSDGATAERAHSKSMDSTLLRGSKSVDVCDEASAHDGEVSHLAGDD